MACGTTATNLNGNKTGQDAWDPWDAENDDDCSAGCHATAASDKNNNNILNDEWSCSSNSFECPDNCKAECTCCADSCGDSCDQNCGTGCSGGCSGCSSCSGSCRTGCTGCSSSCKGGCTGNCGHLCNSTCKGGVQDTRTLKLEKIIRSGNIRDIFRFIVHEAESPERNRNLKVPTSYINSINMLTGWKEEDEKTLMLLYYTIPRIFEDTFKNVFNIELKNDPQSGTLDSNNNPAYIQGNAENYKWYGDEISALEWIEKAQELYNATVAVNSKKD